MIKDVLDAERLAKIRRGCEIAMREMVGRDPERAGNRGYVNPPFPSENQVATAAWSRTPLVMPLVAQV